MADKLAQAFSQAEKLAHKTRDSYQRMPVACCATCVYSVTRAMSGLCCELRLDAGMVFGETHVHGNGRCELYEGDFARPKP